MTLDDSSVLAVLADLRGLYSPGRFPLESQVWERAGKKRGLYNILVLFGLSPRTSDQRLVGICRSFFHRYPSLDSLLEQPPSEAWLIAIGARLKSHSRFINSLVTEVRAKRGVLPHEPEDLRQLLRGIVGCGPKVAECVLAYGLGQPAIPVDGAVCRVVSRFTGLDLPRPSEASSQIRSELSSIAAKNHIFMASQGLKPIDVHELLRLHGRAVCKANPVCGACPLTCASRRTPYEGSPESARTAASADLRGWGAWRELLLEQSTGWHPG